MNQSKNIKKLPRAFYLNDDVVSIARLLLGKYLFTKSSDGIVTGGIITETEAYAGITDRASHAWNGRRTARTEIMYGKGGTAYVYLCYGMHALFNVVTAPEGTPHAVLIRGIYPMVGVDEILKRRKVKQPLHKIAVGPGTVASALDIQVSDTGIDLLGSRIWLADAGIEIKKKDILASPRIGVDYAGEDAKLQWNFKVGKNSIPNNLCGINVDLNL
ncbi:MAG: DNA-3-methyladenine glycosylase [Bacteroidota bacterium]